MISNAEVLDTNFCSALDRMISRGRVEAFTSPINVNLAVAGVMKKRDGGPALLFTAVEGYDIPIIGNLLCCQPNARGCFWCRFSWDSHRNWSRAELTDPTGLGWEIFGTATRSH
jgi:2,5-furandicarboxylate decarboxylase 1